MTANTTVSKEYFSGLMSLYAECKVRVDNNQLQHQACDPPMMLEHGFKGNLTSQCFRI